MRSDGRDGGEAAQEQSPPVIDIGDMPEAVAAPNEVANTVIRRSGF